MTDPMTPISYDEFRALDDEFILGETSQEIVLENSADNLSMTDLIGGHARRSIRIFTRDLDPLIYDRGEFADICMKLAIRSRFSRIEILAFETQRIIRRGHRLVRLPAAESPRPAAKFRTRPLCLE